MIRFVIVRVDRVAGRLQLFGAGGAIGERSGDVRTGVNAHPPDLQQHQGLGRGRQAGRHRGADRVSGPVWRSDQGVRNGHLRAVRAAKILSRSAPIGFAIHGSARCARSRIKKSAGTARAAPISSNWRIRRSGWIAITFSRPPLIRGRRDFSIELCLKAPPRPRARTSKPTTEPTTEPTTQPDEATTDPAATSEPAPANGSAGVVPSSTQGAATKGAAGATSQP